MKRKINTLWDLKEKQVFRLRANSKAPRYTMDGKHRRVKTVSFSSIASGRSYERPGTTYCFPE